MNICPPPRGDYLGGMDPAELVRGLKAEAQAIGFADCRILAAEGAIPLAGGRLDAWLADGAHGSMEWMAARADQRASPNALWPDARSVVMLGLSYAPAGDPLALAGEAGVGRISAYAQGADYHDVVKRGLKALARWLVTHGGGDVKVFVDTAPVMEKPLAEAAGLGWQGKHSNLVSRSHGSWLLLGAIYTTLDLPADGAGNGACGSCSACLAACPTDAFTAPYRLDARRCISYLTIEHKGPIPPAFRAAIGNRVYGCDDCLAVCPWNKFAQVAHEAMRPRAELVAPDIADLLALDDAGFRQVYAGSPIKRIGRDRMVRNALVAAGNAGAAAALVPAVTALLGDPAPVVRGAAAWALGRLDPARFAAERAARLGGEADETVRAEWLGPDPAATAPPSAG